MIALHADPIVENLTRVRRTMTVLRCVKPLPVVELAILAAEELRLLRADCERRRS